MPEFDRTQFAQLMGLGVQYHSRGEHTVALELRQQAYGMAPADSLEQGRAARDVGASFDRMGNTERAKAWADMAYEIHSNIVESMEPPSREAFRERSASAMYLGVSSLRQVLIGEHIEAMGLPFMRHSWADLQRAKARAEGINRYVDQYEINAAPRFSVAQSLFGSRKRGLVIGTRAMALALMSESPRLDTSNPGLSTQERLRAKAKALLGGVAAVGVGVLSTSHAGRRQRAAWSLAGKVL